MDIKKKTNSLQRVTRSSCVYMQVYISYLSRQKFRKAIL